MSEIRVNKVINEAGTGAVELTQGATLPTGKTISGAGSLNITGNSTFTGNVSVGGTLTYEDVTNVDSVGIITARKGVDFNGTLREKVNKTAGKLSANLNIDVENGMVHLFTTAESAQAVPNIRFNGTTSLNSVMAIDESIVVTLITTANANAYSAQMTIDGAAQTERWIGGSAPSGGGSSGVDIHSFTIIKTADATFTVIGNHSKTS